MVYRPLCPPQCFCFLPLSPPLKKFLWLVQPFHILSLHHHLALPQLLFHLLLLGPLQILLLFQGFVDFRDGFPRNSKAPRLSLGTPSGKDWIGTINFELLSALLAAPFLISVCLFRSGAQAVQNHAGRSKRPAGACATGRSGRSGHGLHPAQPAEATGARIFARGSLPHGESRQWLRQTRGCSRAQSATCRKRSGRDACEQSSTRHTAQDAAASTGAAGLPCAQGPRENRHPRCAASWHWHHRVGGPHRRGEDAH